jgi:hypothetical protein
MKKLALFLALMLIPCSAFGLEMLTDNAMDEITGQDGVSIIADDIQLFLNVERFAYVDCDGFVTTQAYAYGNCTGEGAMFSVENFQMDTININAIIATCASTTANPNLVSSTCGMPLFFNYASTAPFASCVCTCTGLTLGTLGLDNYHSYSMIYTISHGPAAYGNGYRFIPSPIEIDITDQLPAASQGFSYINSGENTKVLGVLIGLPTLEIYIDEINFEMAMWDVDCDTNVVNDGDSFGDFIIQGVTFTVLDGWIEIAPH